MWGFWRRVWPQITWRKPQAIKKWVNCDSAQKSNRQQAEKNSAGVGEKGLKNLWFWCMRSTLVIIIFLLFLSVALFEYFSYTWCYSIPMFKGIYDQWQKNQELLGVGMCLVLGCMTSGAFHLFILCLFFNLFYLVTAISYFIISQVLLHGNNPESMAVRLPHTWGGAHFHDEKSTHSN